jgi:hypothetical protein
LRNDINKERVHFVWERGILRGTQDPLSLQPRGLRSDTTQTPPTATKPRPSPTTIRSSRQHLVSSPNIHAKQHQRRNKPRDRAQPRRRKVRRVNIQRGIQHSQPQKGAERGVQSSCIHNPVSIFTLSPHTTITRKPRRRRTQENRIKTHNSPTQQHSPPTQPR